MLDQNLTISVIIPVFNEENTIDKIIEKVKSVKLQKQIIVINDGSKDNTRNILDSLRDIDVIHHSPVNLGKGASIRKGLEFVKGNIVIIQDADLELDPNEYSKLIEPIVRKETSVVYGSRFLNPNNKFPFMSGLANKFLSNLTSILYGSKITDMETCYKVFDSSLIAKMHLESNRFEIEPEITAKLLKKGIRIKEVPITYVPRTAKSGKKINFKDGIVAVYTLLKYRFWRN